MFSNYINFLYYKKKVLPFLLLPILFINEVKAQDIENIKNQKPFQIHGSVGGGTSFYHSDEPYKTRDPFAWNMYANVTPVIYGFSLPFSVIVTQYTRSYTQPFTQFGVSPKYKWVTLHLGYRNMDFSPLVYGGTTFLGGGFELSPKWFRFSAFYGRLNKAIDMEITPDIKVQPQYARIGHGASIGFSIKGQDMSFQYLYATDNTKSLKNVVDSLTRVRPQKNFVLGTKWKFLILKKLHFSGAFASSLLSMDSRYGQTIQLENSKLLKFLNGLFPYTYSTVFGFSGQARAMLNLKRFNLSSGYRRVQPDFKSLGTPYTLSDIEMVNATSGLRLLKNKLTVNGAYSWQRNNLNKKRGSTLIAQTGNLNLTALINKYLSVNSNVNLVNIYQKDGALKLNDSIRMNQLMTAISLSPNINFQSQNIQYSISSGVSYTGLTDRNPMTKGTSEGTGINSSINYSMYFAKAFKSVNFGVNHNLYTQVASKYSSIGLILGGTAQFLKDHNLSLGGNLGYYFNHSTSATINNNFSFSLNSNFSLKKHNIGLFTALVYTPPIDLDPMNKINNVPYFVSTYNLSGGINYSYSF